MNAINIYTLFQVLAVTLIIPLSAVLYYQQQLPKKMAVLERDKAEVFPASDYYIPVTMATVLVLLGSVALFGVVDFSGSGDGKYSILTMGIKYPAQNPYYLKSLTALIFGFLGACLFSFSGLFRRYILMDLPPRVYFSISIRIFVSCVIALMMRFATEDLALLPDALPAFYFMIGVFPESGLNWLTDKFKDFLGTQQQTLKLPLSMIEGISIFQEYRLREESVDNIQNLALADPYDLASKTHFSQKQICDWISQAQLYMHFQQKIDLFRQTGVRNIDDFLSLYKNKHLPELAKVVDIPEDLLTAIAETLADKPAL